MRVEVWSDVVCPWCYLGKRRLASALAAFEHRDEVRVAWRSFELDPTAPREREGSASQHLQDKYGMSATEVEASWARLTALAAADGLEYHLDHTWGGSSFDAHRLIQLGAEHDLQDATLERLFRGYFSEGLPIGEPEVLSRLAVDAGLPSDEVATTLASDRFADAVRADELLARRLGITGVPFFVVDGLLGVSGAQSAEVLRDALEQGWAQTAAAITHH